MTDHNDPTSSNAANGENGETHHEAKRMGRWIRDAVIPAWVAIAAMVTLGLLFTGIIWRMEDTRRDAEAQDRVQAVATCENANEFRTFLGNFLESQGAGAEFGFDDVPGYDELPFPMRAYLINLGDLIFRNREQAKRAAVEYRRDFPVIDCRARLEPAD